jgi:hypothetical protein
MKVSVASSMRGLTHREFFTEDLAKVIWNLEGVTRISFYLKRALS